MENHDGFSSSSRTIRNFHQATVIGDYVINRAFLTAKIQEIFKKLLVTLIKEALGTGVGTWN